MFQASAQSLPVFFRQTNSEITQRHAQTADAYAHVVYGFDLARQRAVNADLVLTLANRKADVAEILGGKQHTLGINYIPSERTRTLLAGIDPLAHLCIVSTFPEFLPIMKAGVQRFAPHVHHIRATVLESPDIAEALATADVVIRATGSEKIIDLIKPGAQHFEYRHTPDPREIDQVLLPMLESIRGDLSASPAPSPSDLRRSHEN